MHKSIWNMVGLAIAFLGLAGCATIRLVALTPTPAPSQTAVIDPEASPAAQEPPADDLPRDTLFITSVRTDYTEGSLQLLIPKLELDVPVLDGTDRDTLLRGVGLYDYAQLPSEPTANTSIAGHRNGLRHGRVTDNMPFYYLDTLGEGDFLYLRDSDHIYQYRWTSTDVVEPDDWSPIYKRDEACLTLTTCTPIGISDHRLILRAALAETLDIDADYPYPASADHQKSAP